MAITAIITNITVADKSCDCLSEVITHELQGLSPLFRVMSLVIVLHQEQIE